jgi:hypothetical protein
MKLLLIRSTVLALAVLFTGTASAGDLVIGHVSLHLGMPQREVLVALSKEFDPKQVSVAEGKYLLWTKEPSTGLVYSAGTVSFKEGKLYRASKFWGGEGVKGMVRDTDNGLFGVLAEIAGKDGRTCRIKAETLRLPVRTHGGDVKLITIELPPDRMVRLQISEPYISDDGKTYESGPTVDEFLVNLPTTK